MGQGNLPGLLAQFMGHYPDVHISLHLTNRTVDLAEEGIDLALRFGPITDDNLIVRRLRADGPGRLRLAALLEEARQADAPGGSRGARRAHHFALGRIRSGASRSMASRSTCT